MHRLILGVCLFAPVVCAEHLLTFGAKGGVPLTGGFPDRTATSVDVITHSFSNSNKYVLGPMFELHLPAGFSIEADVLYHPLNLTVDTQTLPSLSTRASLDINTFEFPFLGKYHFLHTPIVKPYAEAGPIFRATSSEAPYLSKKGFALGAGVDLKLLLVTITPELRYTHWGSGSSVPRFGLTSFSSNENQAQFLIGLSF